MIDLRRLRYLVAVAEEGHVSRAAARLGIQQPPLTRQIRSLEEELGVALFRRLPRGMALTEAGQTVVAEARDILARAARLAGTAKQAARGELGHIAIGYTSSAAYHPLVIAVLRAFRRARPGVSLTLAEDPTSDLLRDLSEERLDIAFVRASAAESPGLTLKLLLQEPMLLVVPADHELAARGRPVRLAALADETFILYRRPSGAGLYDAIIAACHAAGFSPRIGQEAPRLPSTLSFVAAGLGVSIVPASMRRMQVEGVAYLPLAGRPRLTAPLQLATRRGAPSPVLDAFQDEVNRCVAAAMKR